jgi:hypothetical protein
MVVRVVVFLCPVSLAFVVGLLVSRSLAGNSWDSVAIRLVLAASGSMLAFALVERVARRLLPLAFLLRLNLVFPDRAPSRFSVALRCTSLRRLRQWAREAPKVDEAAVLAEKVVTLASALNSHDRRTRGHCERTRALADLVIDELNLSPTEANEVRWGAFLHDIGKLVVPAAILNKPGKPTEREWKVLKGHPEAGARLVEPLRGFLSSGVDAVASHHENYDGTGYPAGLCGEQLPRAARIVAVADSFEVMTAVRAYKRPMTMQAAMEELARRSGTQFDPHIVRAFLNVSLGRLHWAVGMAAWVAELPFLTVIPRAAAQLSATAGGSIAPAALPSIAAASLGAMAVVGHVDVPATSPPATAVQASIEPPLVESVVPTTSSARSTGTVLVVSPSSPPQVSPVPSATPLVRRAAETGGAVAGKIDGAGNDIQAASAPPLGGGLRTDVTTTGVVVTVGATTNPIAGGVPNDSVGLSVDTATTAPGDESLLNIDLVDG